MNESFRIQFSRNGHRWPIADFDLNAGVVMSGEADRSPRSMTLEFDGDSPVTKTRMEWVRQRFGWNAGQFKLSVSLEGGDLVVVGLDPDALPPGLYWVQIHLSNIDIRDKHTRIEIKKGTQDAVVPVPVTPDPRQVVLTTPIAQFDPKMKAVIDASTTLDGMTTAQWLVSPDIRESRKACLLNLLAKLRAAPDAGAPLIQAVRRIIFGTDDRIYLVCDPTVLDTCQTLSDREEKRFYSEGEPHSATHQRLLDRVDQLGLGHLLISNLRSFRQEGGPSMQLVITSDLGNDGSRFVDADLDLGNPLQDLAGFAVHMGELISGKTTDHFSLRKKLDRSPTAAFLYYRILP